MIFFIQIFNILLVFQPMLQQALVITLFVKLDLKVNQESKENHCLNTSNHFFSPSILNTLVLEGVLCVLCAQLQQEQSEQTQNLFYSWMQLPKYQPFGNNIFWLHHNNIAMASDQTKFTVIFQGTFGYCNFIFTYWKSVI